MRFSLGLASFVVAVPVALAITPCGLEAPYTHDILNNTAVVRPRDTINIDLWIHFLVSNAS
jgi:hypothetical protein